MLVFLVISDVDFRRLVLYWHSILLAEKNYFFIRNYSARDPKRYSLDLK